MNNLLVSDRDTERFDLRQAIFVNGREVSPERVYREMQYHPADTPEEAMYGAARSLVVGELLAERSRQLGLCNDDLQPGNQDFDQVVDELLNRELPLPEPTRIECLEYYSQHKEKFVSPPLAEVRHILLAATDTNSAEADMPAVLLQQIRVAIDPLRHFAQLAASHSLCSSRDSGGSLGQVGPGDTVAAFETAVFSHGVGLVPEPVVSPYGVHLIYVEQFEAGRQLSFEMVHGQIEERLRRSLRWRVTRAYLLNMISSARITGINLLPTQEQKQ